jgi:hypothetical protein
MTFGGGWSTTRAPGRDNPQPHLGLDRVRSAALFREAKASTAASSIAKTAQIIQFATSVNVSQPSDFVSASMMRTGISASVAASTTGSNGVWTRPR